MVLSDREIAFNVVDMPIRILTLLRKSTDTTKLLGSRIKLAQVLDVLGIRYLITICISDSVWSWSCNLGYDKWSFSSGI